MLYDLYWSIANYGKEAQVMCLKIESLLVTRGSFVIKIRRRRDKYAEVKALIGLLTCKGPCKKALIKSSFDDRHTL